jgi:polysaccharide biosynthesis protein PslH
MSVRVRVLHLTPELPCALGGTGGSTRQFHLLRRLAELGHEVTVVAPVAHDQEDGASRLGEAGIELRAVRRPASRALEGLRALARRPRLALDAAAMPVLAWQAEVFRTSLRPVVERTLAEVSPDVVTVEHDHAASWAPRGVPAVLTLHNVSPAYYASRGLGLEARRFARHDRTYLQRYGTLVAVSDRDAEQARRLTEARVEVVPNGVATDELRPAPESGGPPTLLFSGTMNHPPNVEGILWFAREILPRIPGARLLVVGRDPTEAVRRLTADPRIEVTGDVPDIAAYFAHATAVVVPLRSGSGTRPKVLEALAAGRAIVSTRLGAEGLEVNPGTHLLLEDDPARFAEAAGRLLGDAKLRARLTAAGRVLVEERYDWRALGTRLAGVLEGAAGRR